MFFKQRFSAFYMVATKDVLGKASERIGSRLLSKIDAPNERKRVVDALIKLDEIEYRTKDFSKGIFSSPDVENCIQKSDFHLINLKKDEIDLFSPPSLNAFLTREEQLMKLIALINHPGLITPSSAERAMQIANTAKLNSGCISRQVGAVITDSSYFIKSIGWNDVAKGHTPCNLRNFKDFFDESNLNDNPHYSDFEKGKSSPNASFKYKGENPGNFKEALIDYFKEAHDSKKNDLNGRNCSFCFKTIHNHYEGEANQVHTRSLHAEENAMLQTTKLGGTGALGGFLFTTASPCELCSKKAYQLGIVRIYYIDPYPGIAVDQILRGGQNRPAMMPFSGAIGNAYDWLYESLLSYKDEMTMVLELKPKSNLSKEFKNLLQSTDSQELKDFAKKDLQDSEIKIMLLKALGSEIKNNNGI
jgi:deoxycytidylate deaminase